MVFVLTLSMHFSTSHQECHPDSQKITSITRLFHDNFTSPFNAISALKKRLIGNYSLLITFYAAKRAFYATFVSQLKFCDIIELENETSFSIIFRGRANGLYN